MRRRTTRWCRISPPVAAVAVFLVLLVTGLAFELAAVVGDHEVSSLTTSNNDALGSIVRDRRREQTPLAAAAARRRGPLEMPPALALDDVDRAERASEQTPEATDSKSNAAVIATDSVGRRGRDPYDMSNLLALMERVRVWLSPFTLNYVQRVPVALLHPRDSRVCGPSWSSARRGFFLKGCPGGEPEGCASSTSIERAKMLCASLGSSCGGITLEDGAFEVRAGTEPLANPSDGSETTSWIRYPDPCLSANTIKASTADAVWDAFTKALDSALEEPDLALTAPLGPTREDGSIFISIASYRDTTCSATLRRAFERAANPRRVSVGIVQQNCQSQTRCFTGTGWAEKRQWVPRPGPDPDCAEAFCASKLGRPHCDAGRVRILRLDEIDSLGPFFTRFVNSKLWRGENFYLQIDAHTDFRSSWDDSLVAQMRATPSYPKSVISNYPPGGSPNSPAAWPAPRHMTKPDTGYPPSALCACTFETAGAGRFTVRLAEAGRSFRKELETPRHSAFVAAGFFIAHGTIVDTVGFDPFLPFLFMGEELALSVRMWTHGYDIYAPSQDVLQHEYVRKESPKFWESVGQVYSHANLHNELTDVVVQRVQYLSKFPEADSPEKLQPRTLLLRFDQFGCGNVRHERDFAKAMGLDFATHRQTPPEWCIAGTLPKF